LTLVNAFGSPRSRTRVQQDRWPRQFGLHARVAQRRGYNTTSTLIGSRVKRFAHAAGGVCASGMWSLLHFDFDRQEVIDHVRAAIGIAMRWLGSAE